MNRMLVLIRYDARRFLILRCKLGHMLGSRPSRVYGFRGGGLLLKEEGENLLALGVVVGALYQGVVLILDFGAFEAAAGVRFDVHPVNK